jgi:hypothetical protein
MLQFSQPSLAVLPVVILHADTITVQARWIRDCVTVFVPGIFHPPIINLLCYLGILPPRNYSKRVSFWLCVGILFLSCNQLIHVSSRIHSPIHAGQCGVYCTHYNKKYTRLVFWSWNKKTNFKLYNVNELTKLSCNNMEYSLDCVHYSLSSIHIPSNC